MRPDVEYPKTEAAPDAQRPPLSAGFGGRLNGEREATMKPTMSMFATMEDYKKAVVDQRLMELQLLGAGDSDCAECLGMNVPTIAICKKCIADTPEFTDLVGRLTRPMT